MGESLSSDVSDLLPGLWELSKDKEALLIPSVMAHPTLLDVLPSGVTAGMGDRQRAHLFVEVCKSVCLEAHSQIKEVSAKERHGKSTESSLVIAAVAGIGLIREKATSDYGPPIWGVNSRVTAIGVRQDIAASWLPSLPVGTARTYRDKEKKALLALSDAIIRFVESEERFSSLVRKLGIAPALPTYHEPASASQGATNEPVAEELRRPMSRGPIDTALLPIADEMAVMVWGELSQIEIQTGYLPIQVKWQQVPAPWTDLLYNVRLAPSFSSVDLSGGSNTIRSTFDKIPSGRLVILGRPGAGKTVLTQQLARSFLESRSYGDPVPVIFSLASWDSRKERLRAWMAISLVKNGYVRKGRGQRSSFNLAQKLVRSGLITPMFDGFDEIPEPARLRAFDLIGELASTEPFVLTSRPNEYMEAVERRSVLTGSAVVQLEDLERGDVQRYLSAKESTSRKWEPVFREIGKDQSNAGSRLRHVLATPFMASLARVAFSDPDADPSEFLDESNYPTTATIEDRLLERYLSFCYSDAQQEQAEESARPRRVWKQRNAERWLGFLAIHLYSMKTQTFWWWQLRHALPNFAIWPISLAGASWAQLLIDSHVRSNYLRVSIFFAILVLFCMVIVALADSKNYAQSRKRRVGTVVLFIVFVLIYSVLLGAYASILIFLLLSLISLKWVPLAGGLIIGVGAAVGAFTFVRESVRFNTGYIASPLTKGEGNFSISLKNGRRSTIARAFAYSPGIVAVSTLITIACGWRRDLAAFAAVPLALSLLLRQWGLWLQARISLALNRMLPWRLSDFLEDARRRGIIYQSHGGYRFRHGMLLDFMAIRAYSGGFGTIRYPKHLLQMAKMNIALAHVERGRLDMAESGIRENLSGFHYRLSRLLGVSARFYYDNRYHLGRILVMKGQYAEAENVFRSLRNEQRYFLGVNDLRTLLAWDFLARSLESLEEWGEAVNEWRELLKVARESLGDENEAVADTRNRLLRAQSVLLEIEGRIPEIPAE